VKTNKVIVLTLLTFLLLSMFACSGGEKETPTPTPEPEPDGTTIVTDAIGEKWELWINGTHLRGANIYRHLFTPATYGIPHE
jgi:hypothetical protein